MAVDRGGLQYRIVVEDQFSTTTQEFRAEIKASRLEFNRFRESLKAGTNAGRNLREVADAAKALTAANRELANSSRERQRAESAQRSIDAEVIRRARAATRERDIARRAEELGVNLSRKKTQAFIVEEQAQERVRQALIKKLVAERAAVLAGERAVALGFKKAQAATIEEAATARVEAARRRLEVAERAASLAGDDAVKLGLRKQAVLTTEQQAENLLARAKQRREVREIAANKAGADAVALGLRRKAALSAEEEASQRIERVLRRQAVARAQIAQLQGRGLAIPESVRRNAEGFNQSLAETEKRGNSLFFTFRRLFGVLALFQGARLLIRGFIDTIKEAIRFNAVIEQSTLGLASLFSAVGNVRDALGQTVTPAQELALAEKEARRQIKLLRQDALNTTATFEDLLAAFQQAVAPGLVAGLNVDQIRRFTLQISQAAGALGLAGNQLAEEIRSILSGTIQARTTRIATALGISNADIRRAKQLGVLFDFLQQKFSSFSEAGEKAQQTFAGLASNIQDAVSAALGLAGEDLFKEVKATLQDIFDILTDRDLDTGLLKPDPRAVAIFREIFDALRDGLAEARELKDALSFDDVRRGARLFGQSLKTALLAAVGLVQGFVEGLSTFIKLFNQFSGGAGKSVQETARDIGRLVALFFTLGIPLRATLSLFRSIVDTARDLLNVVKSLPGLLIRVEKSLTRIPALAAGIARIKTLLAGWGPAIVAAGVALAEVGAILALVVVAFQQVVDKIFDIDASLGETIALFGEGFAGAIQSVIEFLQLFFNELSTNTKLTILEVVNQVTQAVLRARAILASLVGDNAAAEDLAARQEKAQLEAELKQREAIARGSERASDIREQAARVQLELEKRIAAIVGKAAGRGAQGPGFDPKNAKANAAALEGAAQQARTLFDIFNDLPSAISTSGEQVAQLAKLLEDAAKDARSLNVEFTQATSQGNLSGAAQQIQALFNQSEVQAREQTFQLSQQIAATEDKIAQAREAELDATARANRLQADQRDSLFGALDARKQSVELEKQIADVENQIKIDQLAVRKAREEGRPADDLVIALNGLRTKKQELQAQKDVSDEALKKVTLDEKGEGVLRQLAVAQTTLVSSQLDLNELKGREQEIEAALTQLAVTRAATVAASRVQQLQVENRTLLAQAVAERAITIAQERHLVASQQAVLEARNAVDLARVEQQIKEEQLTRDRDRVALLAEQAAAGSKQREQLDALNVSLTEQLELEKNINESVLRQLEERQRLAELTANGSLAQGLQEGLKDFARNFSTEFEIGLDLAKNAITSFAQFASSAIVDAFDPTSDAGIAERFGRFLQGLAQQLLEQLIQLQIAQRLQDAFGIGAAATDVAKQAQDQALLAQRQAVVVQEQLAAQELVIGATTLATASPALAAASGVLNTGAGILLSAIPGLQVAASTLLAAAQIQLAATAGGLAKGGQPGRGWAPSAAHFSSAARGYDVGGAVKAFGGHFHRPAGIDPSDTVPAWLSPEEFVFSAQAVRNMGVPMLEWLHDMARNGFDTSIARRIGRRASRGMGMADGGLVSDKIGQAISSAGSDGSSVGRSSAAQGIAVAAVVPSQEAFDRMLSAGEGPMLKFIRKHSDTIGGILGRGKSLR